jgi:Hypothetical protein (DUF2513)
MKRDLELVRKMLLAIEDAETGFAPRGLAIEGYTQSQVGYHAYLLIEAGFARGSDMTHTGCTGPEAHISSLTWSGHEFTAAARDENRWKKAIGQVKEKSGTITMDALTQLLGSLMRGALGLP